MSTKKPAAKKAAPKKPAAKKAAKPVEKEGMVLYTIRLSPTVISKLEAKAAKQGVTHAAVARGMLEAATARA